jgi:hypothetical protein
MGRGTEADGGAAITTYTIEWSLNADYCTIVGSVDVPESAAVYVIQNLTPNLVYYVRIYASNSQGRSEPQEYFGLLGTGGQLQFTAP